MEINIEGISSNIIGELTSFKEYVSDFVGNRISSVQVPDDDEYEVLDISDVMDKIQLIANNAECIKVKLDEICRLMEEVDKTNSDISDATFKIGDKITLESGVTYYEIGTGEGRSGTIGSDIRPDGDYTIGRVAFYLGGDSKVPILNSTETGLDVAKKRKELAEQYGVDESEIVISVGISYKGGDDTGWLDRNQFNFDSLSGSITQEEKGVSNQDTIEKMEEVINEIDAHYNSFTTEDVKANVVDSSGEYGEVIDYGGVGDFWVSTLHGASNTVFGPAKLVGTLVDTITFDTIDLSGKINKYKSHVDERYRESGSYLSDADSKVQEAAGDFLAIALTMGASSGALTGGSTAGTVEIVETGATVAETGTAAAALPGSTAAAALPGPAPIAEMLNEAGAVIATDYGAGWVAVPGMI